LLGTPAFPSRPALLRVPFPFPGGVRQDVVPVLRALDLAGEVLTVLLELDVGRGHVRQLAPQPRQIGVWGASLLARGWTAWGGGRGMVSHDASGRVRESRS
jgi:hypothetical protein